MSQEKIPDFVKNAKYFVVFKYGITSVRILYFKDKEAWDKHSKSGIGVVYYKGDNRQSALNVASQHDDPEASSKLIKAVLGLG